MGSSQSFIPEVRLSFVDKIEGQNYLTSNSFPRSETPFSSKGSIACSRVEYRGRCLGLPIQDNQLCVKDKLSKELF